MTNKTLILIATATLAASSQAQILFSENFQTDQTANWSFFSSIANDTASISDLGAVADFFFDYGAIGIPNAPNSGSGDTRGLKMQANVRGTGIFSGMSVSPNGQSFTGDYTLRFDAWQSFQGPFPGGGSGTTQLTMGGIGASNSLQFIGGPFNGFGAASTQDGGSASDYRMYNAPGGTIGTYIAGSQNNTAAYYSGFQGTVPAAQTAWAQSQGFNSQFGSTNTGVLGMAWRRWEIRKEGTRVDWYVDGLHIGFHTNVQFGGNNIFLAYSDTNSGSSTDVISDQLLFGLIDNVEVEAIPEPGTMVLLAGLGVAAIARKRKSA
ncbi:PEP-CTERM sorting domain-containing protein [Kamptonema cortianum]|nr:PEP-CTERM sorting domain-containing protein [Geitlerinema splendidum]MDK3161207.1 PEP-CTERM sorting domain-containing protein [Kamptonema cortianum]